MVNDPIEWAIKWNRAGDGFYVLDINQLCEYTFPKYFKHNTWPSFTRQLNMYGFQRTSNHQLAEPKLEFKHPNFKYDNPKLLCFIQRRVVSAMPEFPKSYSRVETQDPEALITSLHLQLGRQEEAIHHTLHILTTALAHPGNQHTEISKAIYTLHNILDTHPTPSPNKPLTVRHQAVDFIKLPPLRFS
ncbi:Heat shock transcription factor [Massospora cicadina]|nr:Heat shock transcription factor [Massospora cicadina]